MTRFIFLGLVLLAAALPVHAGKNDSSPGALQEDHRLQMQGKQRIHDEKRKIDEREKGFANELDREQDDGDSDAGDADAEDENVEH